MHMQVTQTEPKHVLQQSPRHMPDVTSSIWVLPIVKLCGSTSPAPNPCMQIAQRAGQPRPEVGTEVEGN